MITEKRLLLCCCCVCVCVCMCAPPLSLFARTPLSPSLISHTVYYFDVKHHY